MEVWDSDDSASEDELECFNNVGDSHANDCDQPHLRYSRIISIFCLLCQNRLHLSDTVVLALLMFISAFLSLLNVVIKSDLLSAINASLPKSISKCRTLLDVKRGYEIAVCCHKCNQLHSFEKCLDKHNGKLVSKRCSFVHFPNHPMLRYRTSKCGALLLKEVKIGAKVFHYPYRNYCFRSH